MTTEEFTRQHIQLMEWCAIEMDRRSRELGRLIRIVNIKDLSGFDSDLLYRRWLDYVGIAIKISQEYYPESLGCVFVINIPWLFNALWKVATRLVCSHCA
jgi:hypothetical protein